MFIPSQTFVSFEGDIHQAAEEFGFAVDSVEDDGTALVALPERLQSQLERDGHLELQMNGATIYAEMP